MTKYKLACFPFHPPYQVRMFKTGHEFHLIDGLWGVKWQQGTNIAIGSAERPLPDNAKLIKFSEFAEDPMRYDGIILQTPEHIREFGTTMDIPTIFSWQQTFTPPKYVFEKAGNRPVAICTSNNVKRDIDPVIPEGHDVNEFLQRDFSQTPVFNILIPVNRFKQIGSFVTGWEWRDVITELNCVLAGGNEKFAEEYPLCKKFSHEDYLKALSTYMAVFQPSVVKHRSFVLSEGMASGNVVIARPGNPWKYNPSLLKDGDNAIILQSKDHLRVLYKELMKGENWKTYEEIGNNARKTIEDRLPMENMIYGWNKHIEESINLG